MSKTIVITGAGIGLGRALARRFASEGDQVVLLGRTFSKVEAVAAEIGEAAMAIECDVSSPDSVRQAFAGIAGRHATIDVLINNAAVYEPSFVRESTDEQILAPILTNLAGSIYCCRSAIPVMGKGGLIINISSESVVLPIAMMSLYQASKAGLERFSEVLRREIEADGIRVSLVRCGSMHEEGKTFNVDPDIAMQFAQSCMKNGIDVYGRPLSQFTSVTSVFRALIDLPADVQVPAIMLEGAAA